MMIGCIRCHGPLDGDRQCPMCDYKSDDAQIDAALAAAEGERIEHAMNALVDLLAASPEANINPRAWEQLLIYAPKHAVTCRLRG